jgi:uncharacterized protein (DUF433 family)
MGETSSIISAFTEEQVSLLTGITMAQLRYWDRTSFFVPSLSEETRRRPYSRIYSFRDIVCLKILNVLRNEVKASLPHLREVKEKLAHLGEDIWAKTTLYVLNKKVIFHNPETDSKEEIVSGQKILQIPLIVVSRDTERDVRALWQRDDSTIGKIERKRGVASNQEVIAGTRIPVRSVKAFSDAGYSIDQIKKEYPTLTEEDIRAALAHAAAA